MPDIYKNAVFLFERFERARIGENFRGELEDVKDVSLFQPGTTCEISGKLCKVYRVSGRSVYFTYA